MADVMPPAMDGGGGGGSESDSPIQHASSSMLQSITDHMPPSPDQSPQHPWPMVPVLQTLTVLSDGEEEQMEQKMGIENGYGSGMSVTKMSPNSHHGTPPMTIGHHHQMQQHQISPGGQKRKVGRPITSVKTMNRSFPAVDEIRAKLQAGECYVRPRASSSSSDVWALFQEVANKDNHYFTGIVQCKTCLFLTRYHGQITGTSHMRRHHCFSLLFPNSTPANRKPKNSSTTNSVGGNFPHHNNHHNHNNMDADSTSTHSPRIVKRPKKDHHQQNNHHQNVAAAAVLAASFKNDPFLAAAAQAHLAAAAETSLQQPLSLTTNTGTNSNVTIHPTIPKRKFKGHHHHHHQNVHERSLISSNGGGQQQSMLRSPANGFNNNNNSPSSSAASSPLHHSSSGSTGSNNNNPLNCTTTGNSTSSTTTTTNNNNARVQNSRQDLRERLIQFCSEQLVPLKSVTSESFRIVLQSYVRLCTAQMLHQFCQQPPLMNFATTLSSCMSHMPSQMPDLEQLKNYLELIYRQCRDKIRLDANNNLEQNIGSALVCDSDQDACIISIYYIDSGWNLTEAILSASGMVFDINQFVAQTLENYGLQDRKKLSKFTFVSHGGLFGGVSVCLSSMAHIVDKVVDEALASVDEQSQPPPTTGSPSDQPSSQLPLLSEFFDLCHELAARSGIPYETTNYENVEWITRYELMKQLYEQRHLINDSDLTEISFDFNLLILLVKLLEPFRTASNELRKCSKHPTLCHVLLYFHKLKKVLTNNNNIPQNNHHQKLQRKSSSSLNNNRHRKNRHNNNNTDSTSSNKSKTNNNIKSESDSDESDSNEEKEIIDNERNVSSDIEMKDEEDDEEEDEDENDDDDDVRDDDISTILVNRLKNSLLENLNQFYQVQSLHRIATFLWPNFRLLKMLSADEQAEVHDDVRKLLQTRMLTKDSSFSNNNVSNNRNQTSCIDILGKSNIDSKLSSSKSDFDEWEVSSDQDQDEVDKYLSVQLTSCSENFVLQWWKEHSNEFPKLSELAKWILSIPASVTTRERFEISKNKHVDDMLLFLHCNMQTDKFDLATLTKKLHTKSKSSRNKSSSSSSSLSHPNTSSSNINNSNTNNSYSALSLIANNKQ